MTKELCTRGTGLSIGLYLNLLQIVLASARVARRQELVITRGQVGGVAGRIRCSVATSAGFSNSGFRVHRLAHTRCSARVHLVVLRLQVIGVARAVWGRVASLSSITGVVVVRARGRCRGGVATTASTLNGRAVASGVVALKPIVTLVSSRVPARFALTAHSRGSHPEPGAIVRGRSCCGLVLGRRFRGSLAKEVLAGTKFAVLPSRSKVAVVASWSTLVTRLVRVTSEWAVWRPSVLATVAIVGRAVRGLLTVQSPVAALSEHRVHPAGTAGSTLHAHFRRSESTLLGALIHSINSRGVLVDQAINQGSGSLLIGVG